MKFSKSAALGAIALAAALSTPAPQAQSATQQPVQPQNSTPASSGGKVIFSRSVDANGDTAETAQAAPQLAKEPIANDAERAAVTFTNYDLDVRLRLAEHRIAVRAQLTARNDGKTPLTHIPLQISSTLNWERIRIDGKEAAYEVATLNSDADHTGQLHEAGITLATPLAPGASIRVDATYSGTVEVSAQRLLSVGTPDDVALHSDWDRIDTDFTGLRGFGSVLWYPVSAVPVVLGDGARLFDEIGSQRHRATIALFHLNLTVEFPHGQAPTIALVNGHPVELAVKDVETAGDDVPGIATAEFPAAPLGFETPSLFIAIRRPYTGANMTLWTRPEDAPNAPSWTLAEKSVTSFLQQWLGEKPRTPLTLLDLPEAQDAPYEAGAMLATGIQDGDPEQLKSILAHALTHAWMQSPRAWLSEGVAFFMGTLWTEHQQGRDKALSLLEAGRSALALAEPESPGTSSGEPLNEAFSPPYYRTKAAYVLWMLRDQTSDEALGAALRGYDPAKDTADQVPSQLETALEKSANADLKWFFADWVDADHGLPDLTVDNTFQNAEQSGNWLVAVHISNAGYAAADVPVTVRTAGTSVTQRVRIPARSTAVPRILIQGHPTEVQVNDGSVPETSSTVHVTKLDAAAQAPAAKP